MIEKLLRLREFGEVLKTIRRDGWENVVTGLGTSRDKTAYGSFCYSYRLTDEELCNLFHFHDTSKRIVSIRPKELLREGFTVEVADDTDTGKTIDNFVKKIGLLSMFRDGMIWGRLYGGCLLIAGIDDGRDMSEPLEDDAPIRSIPYMLLLDKRYVYPTSYYEDPNHPKYLKVQTYGIQTLTGEQFQSEVHETRVIRFGGAITDEREKRRWNGWDYSVLQAVYDVLRAGEQNWQAVNNLMSDASQGVLKIKGLIQSLIQPNGEATLRSRVDMLDMGRSVARVLLLDADHNEDFRREATPLNGLADLLDRSMIRTSSAAEIPQDILFEVSKGGLNNDGSATYRRWYDGLASEQKQDLAPLLRQVIDWLCRAEDGPTQGKLIEDYEICFPRLWQPTPQEEADIALKFAQRDQVRILGGVWNPSEVALAIAKNPKDPDRHVEIDEELHTMMLENEKELAANGPPEIDPITGQPIAGASPVATAKNGGNETPPGKQKPAKGPAKTDPRKPK